MSNTYTRDTSGSSPTAPEPSRRYVQWKEDDIGLLLADLEQPGHYNKWKENKSGYSKRVAEQVFKNAMYHEAIKFKVRWLESRFKNYHQQLTLVEQDQEEVNIIRDKMYKEFPYYDRCRPIFTSTDTIINILPQVISIPNHSREEEPQSPMVEDIPQNETRSPLTDMKNTNKRICSPPAPYNNTITTTPVITKKRKAYLKPSSSSSTLLGSLAHTSTEEKRIKLMELEIELKKMDHEERMQEMKLEQLKLEIELEKLKSFKAHHHS